MNSRPASHDESVMPGVADAGKRLLSLVVAMLNRALSAGRVRQSTSPQAVSWAVVGYVMTPEIGMFVTQLLITWLS